MEVGAVKQAFNNELIKLKKNLNQAKIQVIHKLTRKAKMMNQKKVPQQLQEKLKRKSESAVNEVLIIKKVKMKELAHFMLSHKGDLNTCLNKPKVDNEKACARLLLHKSLNDKYKFIRDKFASVPINDLLMSRQESRKLKKEVKENKKSKKKGAKDVSEKNKTNELDITGFQIESDLSDLDSDNKEDDLINGESSDLDDDDNEVNTLLRVIENKEDKTADDEDISRSESETSHVEAEEQNKIVNSLSDKETEIRHINSLSTVKKQNVPIMSIAKESLPASLDGQPASQLHSVKRKAKDKNKNKNLKEKLLSRSFKKSDDVAAPENKVVDPFFITETGENYLSVAEARQPDEIKEVHKQGNRRLRRAVMFGHAPKYQPNRDKFKYNNNDDKFIGNKADFSSRNDNRSKMQSQTKDSKKNFDDVKIEPKLEKLHPSWEAKKKQSSNLPFQGKKIVFDDS